MELTDKPIRERLPILKMYEAINQLNQVLEKNAGKLKPDQEKFYTEILEMLYQAARAEGIINAAADQIHRLQFDKKYLLDRNQFLEQELQNYTTVEQLIQKESLDEVKKTILIRIENLKNVGVIK